tara:strand:+ start:3462 stop:3755 length:294 start_codon:yes stop_codon:yes gene_type:complete
MKFWTCGPFKEANDRLELMIFKAEQMKIFMETLEEVNKIDDIINNGTLDEQVLASMVKLDVEKKLNILIGIPDGHEEKNDEILGKAILESFKRFAKK